MNAVDGDQSLLKHLRKSNFWLIPILISLASEFYPSELLLLPLPVLTLIEVGLARLQATWKKECQARAYYVHENKTNNKVISKGLHPFYQPGSDLGKIYKSFIGKNIHETMISFACSYSVKIVSTDQHRKHKILQS